MSQSKDLSPSEIYAINFEADEPKYYTRIPNILSHLTYDSVNKKTGKVKVKRLSVYAKELYRVLRDTAGNSDTGKSWRNRDNLAKLCNMSAGMVTKCKLELSQKFHQLDLNPLIRVVKKPKTVKKDGKKTGGTSYDEITIVNIWPWNNAFMATMKFRKSDEAMSPNDSEVMAESPHDGEPPVALSPCDTNNNPNNKTHLYKEQQPTPIGDPVGSVPFDKKKKGCFSDEQRACYEWLVKEECHEKNATSIARNFNRQDIYDALQYLKSCIAKLKAKGETLRKDKWAYLQDILNNRYWEKK